MTPTDKIVIDRRACAAYGLPFGSTFPAGSIIVQPDGTALLVEPTGALMPRPTPWPWTRPSWAAIPFTRSSPRSTRRNTR